MTTGGHNVHLEYQIVSLGKVTDAYDVTCAPDGQSVTVTMACPRCGGATETTHPLGLAGSKGLFGRRKENDDLERQARAEPVFCECGFQHAQRPENTSFEGCGAQWLLPAPAAGTGGGTP